ncbi:MAG: hypothetical protein PHE06_05715 [Lachnospiraceae bacterium]|nr:hypothetical protein [Lachnospiraceae bacterium]
MDSRISDFFASVTDDQRIGFLNEWNANRDHREPLFYEQYPREHGIRQYKCSGMTMKRQLYASDEDESARETRKRMKVFLNCLKKI